ncbi:MAG: glycosidase [Gemmatimonadota bacterium]|jgi:predicted GH43/DUF377 family glycosyl hydrolase
MAITPRAELLTRHPDNPIITAADLPYSANSVFNPGATMRDGETILLMRVEDRRGLSHLTVARSSDGVAGWRIDTVPTFVGEPDSHPEEIWGIEDPRVTFVDEEQRWIVAYTAYSRGGPLVSLAATEDFETFERLGAILSPENKDAALFPVRFDGRWALVHRPVSDGFGANMWISFSPDLKHWGDHRLLLEARAGGWWDAGKIGLSPPPLKTDQGWLILYHSVRPTASGSIYRLGLALLDLEDPRRVLKRSSEWLFSPSETYERVGDVGNVVFPCGWTLVDDEIRVYYGAADMSIALATGRLSELLAWLDAHADA